MYQSLQGCRAIAAALVVLFHLGGTFAQDRYFGFKALDGPFAWGDAGVDFFFVLSGFLITLAHRRDFGRPAELSRYLSKRILRIYPTYWVICLAVCLAAVVAPALRQALPSDALTYLGALALLPLDPALVGGSGSPILFVAWSLQYEMLFYAVVAVLIANRPAGVAVAVALFATVVYGALTGPSGFPLSFLGSNMILLFGLGVATAYIAKSGVRLPSPAVVAAVAGILFVAFGLSGVGREGEHFVDRRIVNGFLASLVVLGLVQAEDGGTLVLRHRWMELLGDASYSLYLMHIPIISLLVKLVLRSGVTSRAGLVVAFVAIFVVCVACSVLFYRFVERPMLKWLRGRVGRVLERGGVANDVGPAAALVAGRPKALR